MDYIYIELKPGKTNDFVDILDDNKIAFDYLSYRTIIIRKTDFNLLGSDLIDSFASKIIFL